MKIAIVTAFPDNISAPHGGVEAVNVNLVRALAEFDDLQLHVVTLDPGLSRARIDNRGAVTVHRLPQRRIWTLVNAVGPGRRQISRYLQDLKPDIVHSHDVYGLMVKGLPMPRLFTVHGFIYADTLLSGRNFSRFRSRVWKRVEINGWKDQPNIISINPYVRERLEKFVSSRIYEINNPVSQEFFHIRREEQKGVIFSSASIYPRKNTLTLVEAFARLISLGGDARLRLAGPVIDPGYHKRILRSVAEHGLTDKVDFLGKIGAEEVRRELSSAGVYALVSLEENAPMGIEEAMAAGVPVVTSNRCGMPYMLKDGESGFLVDPCNTEEIAGALLNVLGNDELRGSVGSRAHEVAGENFHPVQVAKMTREVYREIVGRGMESRF